MRCPVRLSNYLRFSPTYLGILLIVLLVSCNGSSGRYFSFEDSLDKNELLNGQVVSLQSELVMGASRQLIEDPDDPENQFVQLDPTVPFGLNMTLPNVRMGEQVIVKIRYSGLGKVVIVAQHNEADFYYRKMESKEVAGNEWKELSLQVIIPHLMKGQDLKLYLWNPGQEKIFVDDFSLDYQEEQIFPEFDPMKTLHLYIDSLDMLALQRKRERAFEEGILVTSDDDYVEGIMFYQDSVLPVKLRLKGDWLDHLEGRKWSFRIKMKSGYTWHRMQTFSIHNPLARDFINEWTAHELYRENGQLAPRYGFVPVTLNGKSIGVYAWEEHFDKQLLESMKRREGPIVKFSEDHFWAVQKILIQENFGLAYPFLEAADISAFKESRTLADSMLLSQFQLAADLMYQFQFHITKLSEVFDIERFAAYHALMDLTRGFHGLAWHNQRFYYNPVLNKLEPIFFDGYTELGVIGAERSAIGGWINLNNEQKVFENLLWIKIYQDKEFMAIYLEKLKAFSSQEWITDFLQKKSAEINGFEHLIQNEYQDYFYDRDFILSNAKAIASSLPAFKEYIQKNPDYAKFDYQSIENRPYAKDYHADVLSHYVNAYRLDSVDSQNQIEIQNFVPRPIWVIGTGNNSKRKEHDLVHPIRLEALTKFFPDIDTILTDNPAQWLFCTDDSANQIFPVQIKPFRAPGHQIPSLSLLENQNLEHIEGLDYEGNKLIFRKGAFQYSQAIVIPVGYQVEFEAGCKMDLVKKAMFISYSPVSMKGTESDPVEIMSSDHTGNGFTIIQAKDTCRLKHVVFSGLNTLNYKGWALTGAVNFYESPVKIDSCSFLDNRCEDALNIVRTNFLVSHSLFEKTFADAFDSDFCTGLVNNVTFREIGNDAIDFSGSQVEINNCSIFGAGDKGVSCGEESDLLVKNTTVDGANVGFASKDLSSLRLTDCKGMNLNYGLIAFQKKPEYGPASIVAKKFSAQSVITLHLIETASVLRINNSLVNGQKASVAKYFY